MSVKSFFVPKIALQGEDIPLHAIWEEIDYHGIRIDRCPFLELKEIYNVAKRNMKEERQSILIKKPKVDGYLGIVFQSKQLEKSRQDAWLSLAFLDQDGKMIEKRQASIHLFRPNLVVEEIPSEIKVDADREFVHNRIRLRNTGDGTAVVMFKTRKESQLRRKLPKNITEFRKEFYEDVKENLSTVQKEYPLYSSLVERYVKLLKPPLKERRHLKKMENALNKLTESLEANEDFGWAFIEALAGALLKNIHLITIFENFLQYLSSVASKKILVVDPLEVIPVSTEPRELAVDVLTTDLIGSEYPDISLPRLKVVSNQRGEIPIHRLFEWKR